MLYRVFIILLLASFAAQAQDSVLPHKEHSLVLRKLRLSGNKITRSYIVRREMQLREQSAYTRQELKQFIKEDADKLKNTKLFNSVALNIVQVSADTVDVSVALVERWYIFPEVIVKFADRNVNDWIKNHNADFSRINLGFFIKHKNLWGRNEQMRIGGQIGFTQKLVFQYKFPFIDRRKKWGLQLNFEYLNNNSLPTGIKNDRLNFITSDTRGLHQSFKVRTGTSFRRNYYTTHFFSLGYTSHHAPDSVFQQLPEFFPGGRSSMAFLKLDYSMHISKQDDPSYPLKGNHFVFALSNQGLGAFSDYLTTTLNFQNHHYMPIGTRFNWYNSAFLSFSYSPELPFLMQSGIGYHPVLMRGFEHFAIHGQHYALFRNDLRWNIFRTTFNFKKIIPWTQFQKMPLALYLKTTADLGYIHAYRNAHPTRMHQRILYSLGTGLDLVSWYDVVINFHYTYNSLDEWNWGITFSKSF
ncbi:MAG: hypothetical protein MI784_15800 [Cytophagales bacterium]|nr:hypothetical protein [Cytophagales bacterium]